MSKFGCLFCLCKKLFCIFFLFPFCFYSFYLFIKLFYMINQSCKDENWVKVATYLRDDVPSLVRSETINNVQGLFSILFRALPASAGDFLKWVVEVRRKEEGGSNLSPEENERLALKVSLSSFLSWVYQKIKKTQYQSYLSN